MPFWLMDYRTKCITALQKAPVGSVVLEPELLFQTLGMYAQPSVCSECARRISGPLHTFCRTLAAEIDRRVGEVRGSLKLEANGWSLTLGCVQITLELD